MHVLPCIGMQACIHSQIKSSCFPTENIGEKIVKIGGIEKSNLSICQISTTEQNCGKSFKTSLQIRKLIFILNWTLCHILIVITDLIKV